MRKRAVGIVRVSQPKGREGESFSSPKDQREVIDGLSTEQDWDLVEVYEELHVSGDAPLEERPGLSRGVAGVLTGSIEIIAGAHSERLWWSHEVRAQVLRLVQDAGGEVWAGDVGRLSSGTAAEDFSGEVRTSADRFSRRQNAEKARKAVVRAVNRGVVPFPDVPPGLALDGDNRVVHAEELPTIVEAFELRDSGATIKEVRAFLVERGIKRSYHGVQALLGNRLYVGEVHFGDLVNLNAHKAAVDRALFESVQSRQVARGRRAKSERILARLNVLYCEEGKRMTVGTQTQNGRHYPFYRCPTTGDCEHRMTIGAQIAEGVVIEATKKLAAEAEGRASAEQEAIDNAADAEKAQADLDAAFRAFAGLEGEPAAAERIAELARIRDEAVAREQHSRDLRSALTVSVADWDNLTLDARRGLIATTIRRAVVGREGKGAARITVYPFGK